MDSPDVLRTILSYLNNDALEVLFNARIFTGSENFFRDQRFWFERVKTLTGLRLKFIAGNWKQAYKILERELVKIVPNFIHSEDNPIVPRVLIAMGFDPSADNNAISTALRDDLVNT